MTTTLSATTPEGAAMADLASIIAGCGAFQEACGVTDAEEAQGFVHYPLHNIEDAPNKFPFAVLTSQDYEEERLAGDCYLPSGSIRLILGQRLTNPKDTKHSERVFTNFEGAVIQAIVGASGGGGHYVWVPSQLGPPARTDVRQEAGTDHEYEVWYDLRWSAL